jgi:hypothetical protein
MQKVLHSPIEFRGDTREGENLIFWVPQLVRLRKK